MKVSCHNCRLFACVIASCIAKNLGGLDPLAYPAYEVFAQTVLQSV